MGRKRRRARQGKGRGGALTSLRGGFRSTVRGVTGRGAPGPTSRLRRILSNAITVVLLVAAAALLFRRFGARH